MPDDEQVTQNSASHTLEIHDSYVGQTSTLYLPEELESTTTLTETPEDESEEEGHG